MRSLLFVFLLSISSQIFCQIEKNSNIDLERIMDEIFPVQDDDLDYAELYEIYAQRLLNPINLNTVSEEQLRSLSILNDIQILEFNKYRNENGPLLSVYELQVIPSFTNQAIRLLIPFIKIDPNQNYGWRGFIERVLSEDNNYFITRVERTLEQKLGYIQTTTDAKQYSGSPEKIYSRFRVASNGDFSFGFTMEKDQGERIKWSPKSKQLGFDYISAHSQVQKKGFIDNLIIGDYLAQFGQGLSLGGGFGIGKGSETITTVRRSNIGFTPYTSSAEYGFFRGIALSSQLSRSISLHSFYSNSPRDANTQSSTLNPEYVSSLLLSGFHRTANEMESRKNIVEQNYGSVIQYKHEGAEGGVVIHQTIFSSPIRKTSNPYNQFSFSGSHNTNIGFYWNQSIANFSLFTEVSYSLSHGTGGVLGVLASINSSLDISLLYRRFDKDFYTFYSNAFAESSNPQNEEGIYWGLKYRFSKTQSATGYIDIFRFPWLRFRSYVPSTGSEWLFRYNFTPSKNVLLFLQARQEKKVRNLAEDITQYSTGIGSKTNYWLNADYKVNDKLGFKTRLQISSYTLGEASSNGVAIIQDINYHWKKLIVGCRVALFDTDSYDSRLYVYEKDAWLSFSIPALQGIGLREYILLQYKMFRKIDIWLRWARIAYENQEDIGTGGELINGNEKNDFKAQLRIRF